MTGLLNIPLVMSVPQVSPNVPGLAPDRRPGAELTGPANIARPRAWA
jgi:hypothetical protein